MDGTALHDDTLRDSARPLEFEVRLPWIRSLPLACVLSIAAEVDDRPVDGLRVLLDGRAVDPPGLSEEAGWWFLQDRLPLTAPVAPSPQGSRVRVVLELLIPYLFLGPDRPLIVSLEQELLLEASARSD